jgi:hypothetical protein
MAGMTKKRSGAYREFKPVLNLCVGTKTLMEQIFKCDLWGLRWELRQKSDCPVAHTCNPSYLGG